MVKNVVFHVQNKLRRCFAHTKFVDTFRIIRNHFVLQIGDLVYTAEQLAFSDIGVAQGKRVLNVHAAPDRRTRNKRGGDNKSIFHLS